MRYGLKVLLFLLCSVFILIGANVAYQAINTLNQLDLIERDRDDWQRPDEIIRELNLKDGNVVADVGCGSGYFALKLSPAVGTHGRVVAVDIRKLSLTFLWIRSVLRGAHNVSVILGKRDDPRLPTRMDAVLIVNTYHELDNSTAILSHIRESISAGGRLVIADRGQEEVGRTSQGIASHAIASHGIPPGYVEWRLTQAGFEVIRRTEHFTEQPNEGWWWLIVAVPQRQPK